VRVFFIKEIPFQLFSFALMILRAPTVCPNEYPLGVTGRAGTFIGPIIGCVFLVILEEIFALTLGEAYLIIFGIQFILVVLYFPYGLVSIFDGIKTLALPAFGLDDDERGISSPSPQFLE
jgi:hypothetical protein